MKRSKVILLLGILATIWSCDQIKEDMSDCLTEGNVQLVFEYLGDTGDPAMFGKMIDNVLLMIYDDTGSRVLEREVSKAELNSFQGVELLLDTGDYRAVCWGNVHEHTETIDCDQYETGRIHHPELTNGGDIPGNSHLYYGNCDFSVTPGNTTHKVPFKGAHINMEVYVRQSGQPSQVPAITVYNLMAQYNMAMEPAKPFETTYKPTVGYNTERRLHEALFQVLRFNNDNPVRVEIDMGQAGKEVVILENYMAANDITVNNKNEATVHILIEYSDLGIEVKMPEWVSSEVTPEG